MLNYFNKKSKCSEGFDANVIYKYTCSKDQNISYVGETSIHFSDKSKTTKDPTKTAQYFNTSTIANPAKTQTLMTILKF